MRCLRESVVVGALPEDVAGDTRQDSSGRAVPVEARVVSGGGSLRTEAWGKDWAAQARDVEAAGGRRPADDRADGSARRVSSRAL